MNAAILALGSFVLLVVAAYLIIRPLIAPSSEVDELETSALQQEKEKLLGTIRELDLDLATGKLSEEDHRGLRARTVAEAAEVLQALEEAQDRAASVSGAEPPVAEEAVGRTPEGVLPDGVPVKEPEPDIAAAEDELEREIAVRREALRARACPACGAIPGEPDRFCRLCGVPLQTAGAG